ncbi:MAG: lysoplasmalogenase [Bacteroidales bacterium]|nr:lysoplasmalogenase [Bacteroidales bacterium]
MKNILKGLFVISALIFCFAVYTGNDLLRTVTKPIPVLILIFLIKPNSVYAKLIFAGFIFSLAGDIFLMKVIDKFIFGLAAFLIAHIFYITAFIKRNKKLKLLSSIPFYAAAILLALFFSQYTGKMTMPVMVYIFIIVTMAWRSYVQKDYSNISKFAFIGAVLFVFSDTNIAFTKFYYDYEFSKIATIVLYWSAQYLIAESVKSFHS